MTKLQYSLTAKNKAVKSCDLSESPANPRMKMQQLASIMPGNNMEN
jgi:hypothetical protein